jgi:hypothetical protein
VATVRGLTRGPHHIVQTFIYDVGNGPEQTVFDSIVIVRPGG